MIASSVRLRAAALTAAATLVLSGCAAGQLAETSEEVSAIDGVNQTIGPIAVRGLVIEAPTTGSYAKGASAEVQVVLINTGTTADSLVGVTGSAVTSWQAAQNGAGQGSQQVAIAPGSRVSYGTPESSGSLRLIGLKSVLYPGTSVQITMTFARAGSITAQVPVALSDSAPTAVIEAPSGSSGE